MFGWVSEDQNKKIDGVSVKVKMNDPKTAEQFKTLADMNPRIAGCVRDRRRMAETAKRAWFTRVRPEAKRRETPKIILSR